MQFFILLVGVMVFVFYQFNASPLNFNPAATNAVKNSAFAEEYEALEKRHQKIEEEKKTAQYLYAENSSDKEIYEKIQDLNAADKLNRENAKEIILKADENQETNDKDYVFIHFILNNLPRGLIGLLLAVILSAAMSSTASELNALASTTTIDLYKRNIKEEKTDKHFVVATKWFTLAWGILAIMVASIANLFDNLIQLVNIIGSIFYGNVLGIFLLAFFIKYVKSNAVFVAAIITQATIISIYYYAIHLPKSQGNEDVLSYLWLNLIGCALVMAIAILIQLFSSKNRQLTS